MAVKPIAVMNLKSKTLHDPRSRNIYTGCAHFSPRMPHEVIKSWASAEGRNARVVGKPCKVCVQLFNFKVPPLVSEDDA